MIGWMVVVPLPTLIRPNVDRVWKNSMWSAKLAGPKPPSTGAAPLTDHASLLTAEDPHSGAAPGPSGLEPTP
jgi:hypothetical protein